MPASSAHGQSNSQNSVHTLKKADDATLKDASADPMRLATMNDIDVEDVVVANRTAADEHDDESEYPRGFHFLTLTLGVMAFVLMVALDNYILGTSVSLAPAIQADYVQIQQRRCQKYLLSLEA